MVVLVEIYLQQFGREVADRVCSELQNDGPVTKQVAKVYASHCRQAYVMPRRHGEGTSVRPLWYQGTPSRKTQPSSANVKTPRYLPVILIATQKPTMDCPKKQAKYGI